MTKEECNKKNREREEAVLSSRRSASLLRVAPIVHARDSRIYRNRPDYWPISQGRS